MKQSSLGFASKAAVLCGLGLAAFAISAIADTAGNWTAPSSAPTGGNIPPPIQQIGKTAQLLPSGLLTLSAMLFNEDPGTNNVVPGAVMTAMDDQGSVSWTSDALVDQACPAGQYVSGINASGSIICSSGSAVQYYFGGMYSHGVDGYSPDGPNNPLAGNTFGCPTGYSIYQIWGGANIDNPTYLCLAFSTSGATKVGEFGGMYSATFNNPLAGNVKGCPSGYNPRKITGISGTDSVSYYCYSATAAPVISAFGGMYGGDGTNYSRTNPVTSLMKCPPTGSGWKTVGVLYTAGVDAPLHWCYLP